MHLTTILRDKETVDRAHHRTAGLDEQQRLVGNRIVQFFGVFGVIAAYTNHLAHGVVDVSAVLVLMLVAHYFSLCQLLNGVCPGSVLAGWLEAVLRLRSEDMSHDSHGNTASKHPPYIAKI